MKTINCSFLLVLAASLMVASPAAAQEFQSHTVKAGETCTSIAKDYYGDPHAYDNIHEYNDLSAFGYACEEGTKLRLPIIPKTPDATLVARSGKVRAKSPKAPWEGVDVGAAFFEAWQVNTLDRSRAELGFHDSTQLQMTENTLVVIYGPGRAGATKSAIGRATVERGRLKASLAGLSGAPLEVETPSGIASLAKGGGQITVDGDESRFANHSGDPFSVKGKVGAAVVVKEGHGTRVEVGKPAEKPRPLPPTPKWSSGFSSVGLTLGSSPATLEARWESVAEVKEYHVEVSRGPRALDILVSQRVPANIDSIELKGLTPGDYYVTIVSIDAAKFESVPSATRKLQIASIPVAPSSVIDAEKGELLLGAELGSPKGLECALDKPANHVGAAIFSCKEADGIVSILPVEMVQPALKVSFKDRVVVHKNGLQSFELEFTPSVPPNTTVTGPDGVSIRAIKVRPDALRVNLSPDDASEEGTFDLDVSAGATRLGTVGIEVVAPKPDETTEIGKEVPVFVSALAGYDAVGIAPYWSDDFPALGAVFDLGVGVLANRYVGAELRVGYGAFNGDTGTESAFRASAGVLAGMFDWKVAPYAGLGVGWRTWPGERNRSSVQTSAGAIYSLTRSWDLRGEVGLGISAESAEVALLPEARAGIQFRF